MNNQQNYDDKEIISVVEDSGVIPISGDHLLDIANSAERRIEAVKKIKTIVLGLTSQNDWVDQGGKPYLTASGCHKIARVFGIGWSFLGEPKKIVEEDGHFRYEVKLSVFMKGQSIEVIGSRSSKDTFFTTRYRNNEKITLPPSEVDAGDILKASITNAQAIGISALLGIRGMTWEELSTVGIDKAKVAKVEYSVKEMSEEAKNLKEEIRRMVLDMAGGDKKMAQEMLEEYTSFTGKDGKVVKGKRTIDDLSEKAIPVTYGKIKEAYQKWLKYAQHDSAQSYQKEANGSGTDKLGYNGKSEQQQIG